MPRPSLSPLREPVTLAVGALAVFRLTRLAVEDTITEPIRAAIVERVDEESRLAYFVTCPWCVSVYVAAGWAGLVAVAPEVAAVAGAALAWSAVSGLLASLE